MIKLIKFPAALGLPDASPFCLKAELLLKMAGIPYTTEAVANPARGPKGKLPAIEDGGRVIGDSEFIRRHLETAYGVDFDRGLGPAERAVAHAFCRMLEERTYWALVYGRWIDEPGWSTVRRTFFGGLPPGVRAVLPRLVRRKVRRDLHGQGTGRHSREEIHALAIADLRAVAVQLGDKPYFMGAEPTGADATVWAFVAGVLVPPIDTPPKAALQAHANLVAYGERLRARYFPDSPPPGDSGTPLP